MRGTRGAIAGLAILFTGTWGAEAQQVPINPTSIPQFVQPLPLLSVAGGPLTTIAGSQPLTISMCEMDVNILPPGTPGVTKPTRAWGYVPGTACPTTTQETSLGPVILNTRGTPTAMTFLNQLGTTQGSKLTFYKSSVDQTLHWADPLNPVNSNKCAEAAKAGTPASPECALPYAGDIPTVVHLHGGEVPPELDGGPDGWFTTAGGTGPGYYTKAGTASSGSATYVYPNTQEASPAWFHDHALGATRLNVYAGMAGAYLIADTNQQLGTGLHPWGLGNTPGSLDVVTIPLIIQDRMFDTTGQLFFPNVGLTPEHPFWVPEFVGDTIMVNGKVWPYLNVEPKRYRFLILNGSNARTYVLSVGTDRNVVSAPFWQIGTDGGYLDTPVKMQTLTIMPGERQDVIVDFAAFAPGTTLLLSNSGKTPFPAGAPPQGSTLGKIIQFRVGACGANSRCGAADATFNPAAPGATVRVAASQKIKRLVNPATGTLAVPRTGALRQLTLNEVIDPKVKIGNVWYAGGPMQILLNNSMYSARTQNTGMETPLEGTTEVWEFINTTADAHPIHLHLVQFQLMNRQAYDQKNYMALYNASFLGGVYRPGDGPPSFYDVPNAAGALGGNPDVTPFLLGAALPPNPNEAGWKDTVVVLPGQVTRLAVRWAPTDGSPYFPFSPSRPVGGDTIGKGYVWHCHIIDHEDNEMMRPNLVKPAAGAVRTILPFDLASGTY